jgi:NTE family protein
MAPMGRLRRLGKIASFALRWWFILAGAVFTALLLFIAIVNGTWRLRSTDQSETPNQLTATRSTAPLFRASLAANYMPVKRPFIGIAMSGGGSRSANFAIAVSRQLDRLGVLAHTEVISGVSGGSMTAAYLALKLKGTPTPEFWSTAYTKLRQNFEDSLVDRSLRPENVYKTLTTSFNRGDVWAQILDEHLLDHSTFGALPKPSGYVPGLDPYRPTLLINATSINDPFITADDGIRIDPRMANGYYMAPFSFTQERFTSMRSDLTNLRLSYAVASSSAFPGAINPISLAVADLGSKQSGEASSGGDQIDFNFAKRYIKLADGGLSDNLGIDAVRKLFEIRGGFQRDINNIYEARPCLIIAIDAANPPFDEPRNQALSRDGRSRWWSALVDSTAVEGYDAYLMRRRLDQLDELGIDPAGIEYGDLFKRRPTAIQTVEVRSRFYQYRNAGMEVGKNTVFSRSAGASTVRGQKPVVTIPRYKCTFWHIALEDLAISRGNTEHRKAVASFAPAVLSLATSLNLHSPQSPSCSPENLQAFLDAAAIELVQREDTRMTVCSWLMDAGLSTSGCDAPPPPLPDLNTTCVKPPDKRWLDFKNQEQYRALSAGRPRP